MNSRTEFTILMVCDEGVGRIIEVDSICSDRDLFIRLLKLR
jgi:hypothetical protein